jgi:hypothetical protein
VTEPEESQDDFGVRLIHEDERPRHLGQVESLSTTEITLLKRKFFSTAGSQLVKYPMTDCIGITYKDERPTALILAGTLLVLFMAAIVYFLVIMWDELEPGTKVPIWALGLAAIAGLRWVFMSRRHKLIFEMKDGTKLRWKSLSGNYKYKVTATEKVVAFAKSANLLRSA